MKRWIFFIVLCLSLAGSQVQGAAGGFGAVIARGETRTGERDDSGSQSGAQSQPGSGSQSDSSRNNMDFLKLYAQSAVLMDADTGRILYGKGQDIVRPMASTTKIMTCILALELGKGNDQVKASSYAASQPKVRLGVREGEEYRLEDLLYALMLESYNDAAVMIGEHIGGSVEGFAELMNEKAAGLGCKDTYFITPNGLDGVKTDENGQEHIHSTTAEDLALIMRYCVRESPMKDDFLKITQTQNRFFTDLGGKRSFNCYNHNAFLNMMEGVLSGKTGFTGGAGYSYVGAMENEGRTYVIALLGCGWPPHKTYKWSDARKLYTYGLEHYKMKDVFREVAFSDVPVSGGLCWQEGEGAMDRIPVSMMLESGEMHLPLLMGEEEQVQVTKHLPSILNAPVREGQQVGYVDYSLGGILVKRFPVYAEQAVEKMDLSRSAAHVLDLFLIKENGPGSL